MILKHDIDISSNVMVLSIELCGFLLIFFFFFRVFKENLERNVIGFSF